MIRNSIGILFLGLLSVFVISLKPDYADTWECLEVIGVAIDEKNEFVDGVEVRLYKKNEEVESLVTTNVTYHDHNFKFMLDANENYTIEILKDGYVKRSVYFSTSLPASVKSKMHFSFGFEVIMFKEKKGVDDFYLDFPVALVSYNAKTKVFENNYNYTNHIKKKIKESEKNTNLKTTFSK